MQIRDLYDHIAIQSIRHLRTSIFILRHYQPVILVQKEAVQQKKYSDQDRDRHTKFLLPCFMMKYKHAQQGTGCTADACHKDQSCLRNPPLLLHRKGFIQSIQRKCGNIDEAQIIYKYHSTRSSF